MCIFFSDYYKGQENMETARKREKCGHLKQKDQEWIVRHETIESHVSCWLLDVFFQAISEVREGNIYRLFTNVGSLSPITPYMNLEL